MPSWSGILKELQESQVQGQPPPLDFVRRKYLKQLHDVTKRNTILYASCWTSKSELPHSCLNIADEDLQGLMEVIYGLSGSEIEDHLGNAFIKAFQILPRQKNPQS